MDYSRGALIFCWMAWATGLASASTNPAAMADEAISRNEMFVEGQDGWRFLPAELRFADQLLSPDLAAEVAPAVEAIADFRDQLTDDGIALLVVPVPPKVLTAGKAAGLSDGQLAAMRSGWETILGQLARRGVSVIDLATDFDGVDNQAFCRRDTHWSGRGIEQASAHMGRWLAGIGDWKVLESPDGTWREQTLTGDLGGEPETIDLWFAARPDARDARDHPLLLLGDSHVLVFHAGGDLHATGAGLPEWIGGMLGSSPDVLGVRGSGATSSRIALARRARSDPDYLAGKQAVIWCFAAREFTAADAWANVPLRRKPAGE